MSINIINRRNMLKAGLASIAGSTIAAGQSFAAWKAQGEVRVVFLVGDYYHNPITQEYTWRRVLGPTGWKLMFAQSASFVTPEILATADLFVLCQYATDTQTINLTPGWSPEMFVENRPTPPAFMSEEMEDSIIENVRRGMGLLAIHCSVWNPKSKKFLALLGVEKPIMHTKVQPALIHNLNQNHPITKGIEQFNIGDDEIFNAVMMPGQYELLYNTKGDEEPIDAFGGWCREEGSGRVVALLPGHTTGPYQEKSFKEMMWRSAFWAMKKEIPVSNVKESYF